ncbi:hypothetical protein BX588_10364 [Paraburkholderia eburnea]|nr:hypothetical protein BX588_10364 [Paraburkholderia eburnea]
MAQLKTALQDIPGRQAYFLEVPGTESAAQLTDRISLTNSTTISTTATALPLTAPRGPTTGTL